MTAAEFRLGLAAAALLLLLCSAFAWEGRGWLRVREKRKRREDYNEWFNLRYLQSLTDRDEALKRCRVKLGAIRDTLYEIETDEDWEQRCEEITSTQLKEIRRSRAIKIDYFRMKNERIADDDKGGL